MLDGRPTRVMADQPERIADLRQWVLLKNSGTVWQLLGVHTFLEDIQGALAARQFGAVAMAVRGAMHICLSIRGCARGGFFGSMSDKLDLTFDPFSAADEQEIRAALTIAQGALDLEDEDVRAEWYRRVESFVLGTEEVLQHSAPLPFFRSPQGPTALLGHARTWDQMARELNLPSSVPESWGKNPA